VSRFLQRVLISPAPEGNPVLATSNLACGPGLQVVLNLRLFTLQIVGVVLLGVFEGFKSHYFAGAHCMLSVRVSSVSLGHLDVMRRNPCNLRWPQCIRFRGVFIGIYNAEKKGADKGAHSGGLVCMSAVHLHAVNPSLV